MKSPIFQKSDFTLCDVPVPKGYPQSQTHCGIFLYNGLYYLCSSPYPNKKRPRWQVYFRIAIKKLSFGVLGKFKDGEMYENPCLYVGKCKLPNKIPTDFIPIPPFPLQNTPEKYNDLPAYNSDPDLFIEEGKIYVLNRTVYRTKILEHGYESKTRVSLIRGTIEGEKYTLNGVDSLKYDSNPYISPCLTKFRGKYIFTYLDTNSAIDANTFEGLYIQKVNAISELSEKKQFEEVKVQSGDFLPWHMSIFEYDGKLFSIIACVKKGDISRKIWQMLGIFNEELTELKIYETPLTDYRSYRGAALVREDGMFILYNTTVWEKIKGSKSVDGRDVIVAQMPFKELLSKIRQQ